MKRKFEEQTSFQDAADVPDEEGEFNHFPSLTLPERPLVGTDVSFLHLSGEIDMKTLSFDSYSNWGLNGPHAVQELAFPQNLFSFSASDSPRRSPFGMNNTEPSVVPCLQAGGDEFSVEKSCTSLASENQNSTHNQEHGHNLRPKRNNKLQLSDSDFSDVEDTPDTEVKAPEVTVPKENPVGTRKKRPYYRKDKHPREVLEKVEAERLNRKRLKNRELAARSRKKKKEKMGFLEEEVDRLNTVNAKLVSKVAVLEEQLSRALNQKQ